jgi:hypothetical protein
VTRERPPRLRHFGTGPFSYWRSHPSSRGGEYVTQMAPTTWPWRDIWPSSQNSKHWLFFVSVVMNGPKTFAFKVRIFRESSRDFAKCSHTLAFFR